MCRGLLVGALLGSILNAFRINEFILNAHFKSQGKSTFALLSSLCMQSQRDWTVVSPHLCAFDGPYWHPLFCHRVLNRRSGGILCISSTGEKKKSGGPEEVTRLHIVDANLEKVRHSFIAWTFRLSVGLNTAKLSLHQVSEA